MRSRQRCYSAGAPCLPALPFNPCFLHLLSYPCYPILFFALLATFTFSSMHIVKSVHVAIKAAPLVLCNPQLIVKAHKISLHSILPSEPTLL